LEYTIQGIIAGVVALSKHEKIVITRDNGEVVEGIAPVIISASRSTDIPGCYGEWFINRLKKGYVVWKNPFSGKELFISFKKTRCIVFWTKNPEPFLKYIKAVQQMGFGILFQVTVNNYENEHLEINLPSLKERIKSIKELSTMIGKEKVLWRFDPIILSDRISKEIVLDKIGSVGDTIHSFVGRLTISFLSPYKKVLRNLKLFNIVDISDENRKWIAAGINDFNKNWNLPLYSCAEPLNLSMYGISHGSCVDPLLITECFGEDPGIVSYYKMSKESDLFGKEILRFEASKDNGQRKDCYCSVSKDIGMYNTCSHGCLYCYANTSPVTMMCSKLQNSDDEFINVQ
jgi:DNA repair photolyase